MLSWASFSRIRVVSKSVSIPAWFPLCSIWNKTLVSIFCMSKFSLCRGYFKGRVGCKSSKSEVVFLSLDTLVVCCVVIHSLSLGVTSFQTHDGVFLGQFYCRCFTNITIHNIKSSKIISELCCEQRQYLRVLSHI